MLTRMILHNEMSVDGRLDWIESDMGLYYGLAERFHAQAMLCGSNTLLAAFPANEHNVEETVGFEPPAAKPDDPQPLLVGVDSRGRLRNWYLIWKEPWWRGMISLCSRATPREHLDYLKKTMHVETVVAGKDGHEIDRVDVATCRSADAPDAGPVAA